MDALNRIRGPFNLTTGAQAAGVAALADQAFVEASRTHNQAERARFVKAIEALGNHGLTAVPSQANFVLVGFPTTPGRTAAEAEAWLARGYAARTLGQHFPALRAYAEAQRLQPGNTEAARELQNILLELRAPYAAAGISSNPGADIRGRQAASIPRVLCAAWWSNATPN